MKRCIKCDDVLLSGKNWTPSKVKRGEKICRTCAHAMADKYKRANRDKVNANKREWRKKNIHREKPGQAAWRKANRDKANAYTAKYRASKLEQAPAMNKAELVEIDEMYRYHQIFNAVMPKKAWDVDHIEAISNGGLHHPSNLQVLTAHDNRSKGARL